MNPNQNRKRGKATERNIAKRVGGVRVGLLGNEDINHPEFSIEVKDRKKFTGVKYLEQAERNCPDGKIPIAIVHVTRQCHGRDVVLVRLNDWQRLVKRNTK